MNRPQLQRPDDLLYPLYAYLRRHEFRSGVDDYLSALRVVRAGRGLEDVAQLKATCRMLWAKSHAEQLIFDEAFANLVEPLFGLPLLAAGEEKSAGSTAPDDRLEREQDAILKFGGDTTEEVVQSRAESLRSGTLPVLDFHAEQELSGPDLPTRTFELTPRLPFNRREVTYIWRQLRRLQRIGPLVDLDIDGTIAEIARQAYFLRPVLQAQPRNQASILLLIDVSNSMAPFDLVVDALVESILRSGFATTAATYYFQNTFDGFLSPHRNLTQRRPLTDVLASEARWAANCGDQRRRRRTPRLSAQPRAQFASFPPGAAWSHLSLCMGESGACGLSAQHERRRHCAAGAHVGN